MKVVQVVAYSDLYKAGVTEDGEDYIAERYHVQVELADGTRYRHCAFFNGAKEVSYEEGYGFIDLREEAKAAAEKLARRVQDALRCGLKLDLRHWYKDYPAYGSQAYQEDEAMGLYRNDPIYN